MDSKKANTKKHQHVSDWLMNVLQDLNQEQFTGSIRINFHKGQISRKIEKTLYLSE
ncbi:MAG: hypothetical protein ACE5F7_11505 [Nitrospiria bacterium]